MAQTYARLTGDLWLDPGLASVPDDAFRIFITAISYSAAQLSDGFVPDHVAQMLRSNLDEPMASDPWEPLIQRGLWLRVEGGFQIKGYLTHNKSRADIEAARAKNQSRVSKHREARAQAVTADPVTPDVTHYSGISNTPIEEEVELEVEQPKTTGHADARPKADDRFDEFWSLWPSGRKHGKGAAVKAFRSACRRATPDEIIAGAARFVADPNLPTDLSLIPHASTWLNADRWDDPPLPPRETSGPPPFRPTVVKDKCPEHPRMTQPCATCAAERAAGLRKDPA